MSESKRKSSSHVAGTAKKHQAITMETKVKIIERVERGKKMVDDFIELLAVQHEELTNEDLIELEAQRKDEENKENYQEDAYLLKSKIRN